MSPKVIHVGLNNASISTFHLFTSDMLGFRFGLRLFFAKLHTKMSGPELGVHLLFALNLTTHGSSSEKTRYG